MRCRAHLGLGVLESVPSAVNFPTDDPLYQGNQWNHQRQNPALAEADLVLVAGQRRPVDSDRQPPGDGGARSITSTSIR